MTLLVGSCIAPATTPSPTTASPAPSPSPTLSPSLVPSTPDSPTPPPNSQPSPAVSATPSATPGSVAYAALRGDSLSLIAARFGTTWQSLVYWNRDRYPSLDPAQSGHDPNRLEVGWQLIVWPGGGVAYNPPLPTPTLRPPPPPSPTPTPGTASLVVSHGSPSSTSMALTFDMGGRTEPAVPITTWLSDHGVPAMIFMTGASVETTSAGRQVISIVNARPDLFDQGNHSNGHPDLTTLSAAQVADELRRAEAAIDTDASQSPRPLFRPPYGARDSAVLAGAGSAGYRWTVLWDVGTRSWRGRRADRSC